jgi:hypothetical protein
MNGPGVSRGVAEDAEDAANFGVTARGVKPPEVILSLVAVGVLLLPVCDFAYQRMCMYA